MRPSVLVNTREMNAFSWHRSSGLAILHAQLWFKEPWQYAPLNPGSTLGKRPQDARQARQAPSGRSTSVLVIPWTYDCF